MTGSPRIEPSEVEQLDGLTGSLGKEASAIRHCDGLTEREPKDRAI